MNMATATDFTALFKDLPAFPFNEASMKDAAKKWATFNEKFAAIAFDAAGKSADIYTQAAKDSIALLRDATKARADVSEYATAATDLGAAQVELTRKNVEAIGEVVQTASGEATELFAEAGKFAADSTAAAAPKPATTTARKTTTAN